MDIFLKFIEEITQPTQAALEVERITDALRGDQK